MTSVVDRDKDDYEGSVSEYPLNVISSESFSVHNFDLIILFLNVTTKFSTSSGCNYRVICSYVNAVCWVGLFEGRRWDLNFKVWIVRGSCRCCIIPMKNAPPRNEDLFSTNNQWKFSFLCLYFFSILFDMWGNDAFSVVHKTTIS